MKPLRAITLDEIHDRYVETDSILFLLRLRQHGQHKRIVLMSATGAMDVLLSYFETAKMKVLKAPVVIGESRYDVHQYWLDEFDQVLSESDTESDPEFETAVKDVCAAMARSAQTNPTLPTALLDIAVKVIFRLAVAGSVLLAYLPDVAVTSEGGGYGVAAAPVVRLRTYTYTYTYIFTHGCITLYIYIYIRTYMCFRPCATQDEESSAVHLE